MQSRFFASLDSATLYPHHMEESRSLRRAKLHTAIERHRRGLYVAKIAQDRAPATLKKELADRIRQMTAELKEMEDELHELNVQQIREDVQNSRGI